MSESPQVQTSDEILKDPNASLWLKAAIETAVLRDPVDALNDALVLAAALEHRLRDIFELG
jgi:hypothetical protein